MKMQPLPLCGSLSSVPKYEHAKPQSPGECKGASLIDSGSFMSLHVKETSGPEACSGGWSPDTFLPAFGKSKMLTSEACHKNYVIFDRCEGKNTVILHPSWLNSPLCYSVPEPKYFGGGLQTYGCTWIEDKFDCPCSSAALRTAGLQAPFYNDAAGRPLLQKMASSNKARCSLVDFVDPGHVQNSKKNIMRAGFLSDIEGESCDEFHENTDEIDALLSSDNELSSTGHSPSDASSNSLCEANIEHDDKIIGKKRKLGYSTSDEVDDADSGSCQLVPDLTFRNSKRLGRFVSSHVLNASYHMDTFPRVEASEVSNSGNKSFPANDVFAETSEWQSVEGSGTIGCAPSDSSRRIKIKNNVQQLKSVIPGGDGLDAAGVLGRSIQYVRCLQRRLRDLEAVR